MFGRIRWDRRFVEYRPEFIEEETRKRTTPRNTNLKTREFGLMPKTGDYMEVLRSCFGGSGGYFVPVRMSYVQLNAEKQAGFDLDLIDAWGQSPFPPLTRARDFDPFLDNLKIQNPADRERLRQEGSVFGKYRVVLLGQGMQEEYRETREIGSSESDPVLYLCKFIPGKAPNAESPFAPIQGIAGVQLKVEAVLHPLLSLPMVLLRPTRPAA